jgi:alpha-tubulin suppressor-like RCC1 family protein
LNGGVDAEGDLAAPWIHSEYQNWKNAELEAENRTLVVWATPHSGAGSAVPLQMPGGIAVLSVSCGLAHTAAVTVRGELFTWGANDFNQLGRPLPSGGGVFPVPGEI